jgi:hypothetical protein
VAWFGLRLHGPRFTIAGLQTLPRGHHLLTEPRQEAAIPAAGLGVGRRLLRPILAFGGAAHIFGFVQLGLNLRPGHHGTPPAVDECTRSGRLNLLTAYHTPLPQSRDNRGFIALYIGLYRLHVKLSHWKTRYRNQGMITDTALTKSLDR